MSDSTWGDPRITAYVLGELPEQELLDFENELESNSELAAAVEEARNVTGQLKSLYASEATGTLDEQRREAIVLPRQGSQGTVSLSDPGSGSWKAPLLVLAMAASLLLLIGVGPWLNQQNMTVSELSEGAALENEARSTEAASDETEFGNEVLSQRSASEAFVGQQQSQPQQLSQADKLLPLGTESKKYEDRDAGQNGMPEQPVNEKPVSPEPAISAIQSYNPTDPSLPDLSLPGLPDVALMVKEKDAGDVQVEFAPQKGAIVVRGGKRDLERVERAVTELEELADAQVVAPADTKELALTPAAPPSPAPTSRPPSLPPARQFAAEQKQLGDVEVDFESQPSLAKNTRRRLNVEKFNAPTRNLDALSASPTAGPDPAAVADSRYLVPQTARGAAVVSGGVTREAQWGTALGREKLQQLQLGNQAPDYGLPVDEGRGPGIAGDRFDPITDNPFKRVSEHPLSTFSVDVDTASYSKTRDFLVRAGQLPRPDAVRIEELLNYFDYNYAPPSTADKHPFAARVAVTSCPWNKEHRLARIALKGKTMDKDQRPPCNLVFLLDTSGSMKASNKLPLVLDGMQMLLKQLNQKDQVAITVYAGSAGLVLDSTSAKKRKKIRKALTQLSAGGSTNGGAGIALAYQTARDNFITDGVNRVILCTDGDFNVGTTGTDELVRMVENEAKDGIFLSVLGFGMGNHNDAMLEKVSGRGNGNYAFIDTAKEARKVLVDQTSGTLVTIAKDVKLQIEFNPSQVSSYRLIGYENRVLAKEDFNDDKKDAGEIGAGHAVTALYEIVPAGVETDAGRPKVDDLKYQSQLKPTEAAENDELMTLKLRYKQPEGDTSTLVEFPVADDGGKFKDADDDVRFAAAVAGFGMQLRRSQYAGSWTLSDVLKVAGQSKGDDKYELRAEFVELVRKAKELMGHE